MFVRVKVIQFLRREKAIIFIVWVPFPAETINKYLFVCVAIVSLCLDLSSNGVRKDTFVWPVQYVWMYYTVHCTVQLPYKKNDFERHIIFNFTYNTWLNINTN